LPAAERFSFAGEVTLRFGQTHLPCALSHITWCTNRLEGIEATCAEKDGAQKGILRVRKGASADNNPGAFSEILGRAPVAHTQGITDQNVARTGLADLVQLRYIANRISQRPGTDRIAQSRRRRTRFGVCGERERTWHANAWRLARWRILLRTPEYPS
jgi:hypothetical protein